MRFLTLFTFSSVLGLSTSMCVGPHGYEMFCECLRRSTTVLVHCALSTVQLYPHWSCLTQNRCFRTIVRKTQTLNFGQAQLQCGYSCFPRGGWILLQKRNPTVEKHITKTCNMKVIPQVVNPVSHSLALERVRDQRRRRSSRVGCSGTIDPW